MEHLKNLARTEILSMTLMMTCTPGQETIMDHKMKLDELIRHLLVSKMIWTVVSVVELSTKKMMTTTTKK